MVDKSQKATHIDGIWIYVSEDLEKGQKAIYPQFGRFRWPESANPADLTKSENVMFFDFLLMFIFRIVNLTNAEFWAEITMQKMIILHES